MFPACFSRVHVSLRNGVFYLRSFHLDRGVQLLSFIYTLFLEDDAMQTQTENEILNRNLLRVAFHNKKSIVQHFIEKSNKK